MFAQLRPETSRSYGAKTILGVYCFYKHHVPPGL